MAPRLLSSMAMLGALGTANAFWRMECRGRTALARIDPIVNFGETATHVHTLHGSSGISESATTSLLQDGNCTSCAVTQDMSEYWTPPLYFQFANGTFEVVQQDGGMLAYYLLRGDDVQAFPEGFQMLAGDQNRRNYTLGDPSEADPPESEWAALGQTTQSDLAQRALGFNCLNYEKDAEASLYRHYMPEKSYLDANCPDGLRLELAFPSCWNGKDLDSDDHKSHMAYPDLVQDGTCPDGFETRVVTLFYETIWATYKYDGVDGTFVLGNGDPTGYGYHGDFITGWDEDFLQSAVDECTNLSGLLSDCPLFNIQSEEDQRACTIESMPLTLSLENVVGGVADILESLPGNVAIKYGPEPANADGGSESTSKASSKTSASSASTSYSAPTLTYKPASSTSGAIFLEQASSSAAATSVLSVQGAGKVAAPATTAAASLADAADGYETVMTSYITNGNVVQEIVYEEAVVTVTEETVTTVTVSPAERKRDHMKRHNHHHHAGHF
ncbi:hypothetical protein E8E14_000378 [Neopestalotiopsis sp. 37M]|nr:hypothetical protein E8E14_000378 [Neopestalotiopsis sp. 37M]